MDFFTRVGDVTCTLGLPTHSRIHPVFHASCLRNRLGNDVNSVDTSVLVDFTESLVQPHEPECILYFHEQPPRHHVCTHTLVKWKGSCKHTHTLLLLHYSKEVYKGDNIKLNIVEYIQVVHSVTN